VNGRPAAKAGLGYGAGFPGPEGPRSLRLWKLRRCRLQWYPTHAKKRRMDGAPLPCSLRSLLDDSDLSSLAETDHYAHRQFLKLNHHIRSHFAIQLDGFFRNLAIGLRTTDSQSEQD
jgi:hypothetical protein